MHTHQLDGSNRKLLKPEALAKAAWPMSILRLGHRAAQGFCFGAELERSGILRPKVSP
jgi:hypothetical protein